MKSKLPVFGIVSAHTSQVLRKGFKLNYETESVIESASKYYKEVLLIDPLETSIDMAENDEISVYHKGMDISKLTTLFVRGTSGVELPIRAIVNALANRGCDIVDPLSRFAGTRASKMFTTINRHRKGVGSTSYIVFSLSEAHGMIERAESKKHFPLFAKPIYGKHGKGVAKLQDKKVATEFIQSHFYSNDTIPLLIQKWNNYIKEYRVLVIHGECMGVVEKRKKAGVLALNAASSDGFTRVADNTVAKYTLNNVSSEGLLGVDVGMTSDTTFHIIEANRAPQWVEFEKATGFKVADMLMEKIYWRSIEALSNI